MDRTTNRRAIAHEDYTEDDSTDSVGSLRKGTVSPLPNWSLSYYLTSVSRQRGITFDLDGHYGVEARGRGAHLLRDLFSRGSEVEAENDGFERNASALNPDNA